MSGPGSFFGLEIARRGLIAHQISMDVTGHNIANANTPGYSRQQAVHKTGIPLDSGTVSGQLGSGVEVDYIRRIRNEYLDTQVRDSTSANHYWENRAEIMQQIESIFPEPNGRGIQEVLLNFFSDWHDLNNTPQDDGLKSAVVESGKELARLFRDTYDQLQNVNESILVTGTGGAATGGKLKDQVDRVNELTAQIKQVTGAIIKAQRENRQPNDLLDKRDVLLDELAEYGPVEVQGVTDNNGEYTGAIDVTMFGKFLVKTGSDLQVTAQELTLTYDEAGEKIELHAGDGKVVLDDQANVSSGSLAGVVSAWQENNRVIEDLNTLARELGKQVNTAYASTGDPNWTLGDAAPEDVFFVNAANQVIGMSGSVTAGDFFVLENLVAGPANLDGTKALEVARLRNQTFSDLENSTLEGYYQGIISQVGAKTSSALNMYYNQETILGQVKDLRESTSGVSLDEELSNMIQFQYGYQASARVMSTIDELLDTLINRMAV